MAMLSSLLWDLLYTIIGLGLILILYVKYNRTYWQRRGVPTVPGHWLFGNIKDMFKQEKSPAFVIGDLYRKAEDEDILGIYIFHKPVLLMKHPDVIKQILVKDFNYFPDRAFSAISFKDKIGSSNLFAIHNPEWKYLRNKLSPAFTSGKIKKMFNLVAETAQSLSKYLEEQFSNGTRTKTILMKDVALKYTTDIISTVAFGVQVNSFDPKKSEFFEKSQQAPARGTLFSAIQLACMFFFPQLTLFLGVKILGKFQDYFRKVFWDSMDSREVTKTNRGDVIDSLILLKNEKQDSDFKFEGDVLLSQSAIFFIAGRESSLTTICFTLYELAKQPDIQKRAREEIHKALKEQGLTYESFQSMKYLQQIISETLRLYPPAPLIDRICVKDYKLPGTDIVIEKGTSVYVALNGIHMDPKYHPDPLRFNPDRFSDENKDNITPFTYMPFGEGPRICVAARLGTLQSSMAVITILKDYEVSLEPTNTGVVVDVRSFFLSPAEGSI